MMNKAKDLALIHHTFSLYAGDRCRLLWLIFSSTDLMMTLLTFIAQLTLMYGFLQMSDFFYSFQVVFLQANFVFLNTCLVDI